MKIFIFWTNAVSVTPTPASSLFLDILHRRHMLLRMNQLGMKSEALHSRGKIRRITRGAEVTAFSRAGHGQGGHGQGGAPSLRQDDESLSLGHFIWVSCKLTGLCKSIQSQCKKDQNSYVQQAPTSVGNFVQETNILEIIRS